MQRTPEQIRDRMRDLQKAGRIEANRNRISGPAVRAAVRMKHSIRDGASSGFGKDTPMFLGKSHLSRRGFLGGVAATAAAFSVRGSFAEELTLTPPQTEGPYEACATCA